MMGDEMMVPVDPKCVPVGYDPVRVGVPNTGDMVSMPRCYGGGCFPSKTTHQNTPHSGNIKLIIRQTVNHGKLREREVNNG